MAKKTLFFTLLLASFILTSCGHEHTWKDATCTEPKTCTECGETEGEPLGHSWIDATCTSPKTCELCGQTEGEPNGHSVEIARCTICGEIANEDLCTMLNTYMNGISSKGSTAIDLTDVDFTSLSVAYYASTSAQPYLDNVSKDCESLIKLCGDYEELKAVKTAAETVKKSIPSKISSSKEKALWDWYDDFANYCSASADLYRAYASFAETLKE